MIILHRACQCCCLSRNIALVTPQTADFFYQKYIFRIKVSKKTFNLILEKASLVHVRALLFFSSL